MKLPTTQINIVDHAAAGLKIRAAREKSHTSLRRLAHLMGISPPFLSDLERGRRNWTPSMFEKADRIIKEI